MIKFPKKIRGFLPHKGAKTENVTPETTKPKSIESKKETEEKSIFETSTFSALPAEYLDRYSVGDVIVTITTNHKYLVYEPQFKSVQDKHSYDVIMNHKILIQEDRPIRNQNDVDDTAESYILDSLMKNIKTVAAELGLYDVLQKNYQAFQYYAKRDVLGYEVIDSLMNDSVHLEDISCSNYKSVGVIHRDYLDQEMLRTNISFKSPEHMDVFLERIARRGGKHISSSEPIVDFHLDEKYRVAIISSEAVSGDSSALTIRLKSPKPFTITKMIADRVIPASVSAVIWRMLDFRGTGLIIGGTGAGKSSMLNTLFPLMHHSSKIITIEDAAELQIPQFDWIPLLIDVPIISEKYETKFQEFLNAALRHRPKMISVGEVRGKSTANLFDVMSTGHSSLASFHSSNPQGAANRIINEFRVHPASFSQLWFILHMGVILDKNKQYKRKCISFSEVYYDGEKISMIDLCRYDAVSDSFEGCTIPEMIKKSKKLAELSQYDASSSLQDDLDCRVSLLGECIRQNASSPEKVMNILSKYYE